MFEKIFRRKAVQQKGAGGCVFAVDAVAAETEPIWTEPLAEHVAKRFQRQVLLLPEPQRPVTNTVMHDLAQRFPKARQEPSKDNGRRLVNRCHGLIDAVSLAFGRHRPLILTPDCIWLAIEQGFAHHLTENAEALRPRLVQHQGKKTLSAAVTELSVRSFGGAIANFSAQIREASDRVLHETLVCDFSTTTPVVRTASEVVLMDAYSSYFAYEMAFVCGIPKITVTGSVEDWQRIRSRMEVLATYDLEWWAERLRPILDEFVRTANGEPNIEFWKAICKPEKAYGATAITGWIADLFPYLNDRPNRVRNHVFNQPRAEWSVAIEHGVETRRGANPARGARGGVASSSFPSGLASVPFRLSLPGGAEKKLDLVGGFFGVEQSAEDLALSPVISWAVAEPAPSRPVHI